MRGLAANGLAQIVNIAYQVVSIPLLIVAWGSALYGEWLVLSAIPAYLVDVPAGEFLRSLRILPQRALLAAEH